MTTTLNFKSIIDLPKWKPLAIPLPNNNPQMVSQNLVGYNLVCDLRNNEDRHPLIYKISTNDFQIYNTKTDEWQLAEPSGLTISADLICAFMPEHGPSGTIAAGATTTSIPLSTALPATVGVNQLANRGDGRGYKIRIIGNVGGSSGKTEERLIVANTGETTTPTLTLNSALSFTPANGDRYEFLSGKIYLIIDDGTLKFYDVATNAFGNLAAHSVFFSSANAIPLSELYVPYDRNPGEGFFNILTATATGAASLTGQAVGGDAGVVANQYRNFQIRIVEDTGTPTAAGQRRNITSHTAGASPVYTVPAWTVTPSATAKYVIENNGDRIIMWSDQNTNTNTYNIAANTWDTVTFTARSTTPGVGMMAQQSFAIEPDPALNSRQSFIYSFRGRQFGTGSNTIDLFNISGAATGTWTDDITYGNKSPFTTFQIFSSATQDPATNQGRYMYINQYFATVSGPNIFAEQKFYKFDMKNRVLEPVTMLKFPSFKIDPSISGFVNDQMMAYSVFVDGSTKLSFIYWNWLNTTGPFASPTSNTEIFFYLPIIEDS